MSLKAMKTLNAKHLDSLAEWGPNWDGRGALPITTKAIDTARRFLEDWPSASIIPTHGGGISLESESIEIEIGANGRVSTVLFGYGDGDFVSTAVPRWSV